MDFLLNYIKFRRGFSDLSTSSSICPFLSNVKSSQLETTLKAHKFVLQEHVSWYLKIYQKGINVRCFTFSLFHLKTHFSNSTCHFLTGIQLWSVISEYLSGLMPIFSTNKVLCRVSSLPWGRTFFSELIKAQVPYSFMDFIHLQASCPGTQAFWRSQGFLFLLQVFLVNCCFLEGRSGLLYVLWQHVCTLYRNTILWRSHGELP